MAAGRSAAGKGKPAEREAAAIGELPGVSTKPAALGPAKRAPRAKDVIRGGRWQWQTWVRLLLEISGLGASALIFILFALGRLADWFTGDSFWFRTLPFAGGILVMGVGVALFLRGWVWARSWFGGGWAWIPPIVAIGLLGGAVWASRQPRFDREVSNFQTLIGGSVEVERLTIAHQVFAAYRRADLEQTMVILERARVFEPTVIEAATAFKLDPEILIGVGAAESSYYPRTSNDGGQGLFQITKPPEAAVKEAMRKLKIEKLDPVNQRHNAFLGAATLRRYLNEMKGDLFLGLLAYNIGPKNGGLVSIMEKYGAKDFVTIQPYLKNLPRDYPIRVLSAALAYRLWKTEAKLPRYEEGDNAIHIQSVGIPGLDLAPKPTTVQKASKGN